MRLGPNTGCSTKLEGALEGRIIGYIFCYEPTGGGKGGGLISGSLK